MTNIKKEKDIKWNAPVGCAENLPIEQQLFTYETIKKNGKGIITFDNCTLIHDIHDILKRGQNVSCILIDYTHSKIYFNGIEPILNNKKVKEAKQLNTKKINNKNINEENKQQRMPVQPLNYVANLRFGMYGIEQYNNGPIKQFWDEDILD